MFHILFTSDGLVIVFPEEHVQTNLVESEKLIHYIHVSLRLAQEFCERFT